MRKRHEFPLLFVSLSFYPGKIYQAAKKPPYPDKMKVYLAHSWIDRKKRQTVALLWGTSKRKGLVQTKPSLPMSVRPWEWVGRGWMVGWLVGRCRETRECGWGVNTKKSFYFFCHLVSHFLKGVSETSLRMKKTWNLDW